MILRMAKTPTWVYLRFPYKTPYTHTLTGIPNLIDKLKSGSKLSIYYTELNKYMITTSHSVWSLQTMNFQKSEIFQMFTCVMFSVFQGSRTF